MKKTLIALTLAWAGLAGTAHAQSSELYRNFGMKEEELAKVARNNLPNAISAKAQFKKKGQPGSIYSLMVRANFPDLV